MIKIEREGYYDDYVDEDAIRWIRIEPRDESGEFDVTLGFSGMDRVLNFSCPDEDSAIALQEHIAGKLF
jgi:hypothetical protein